MFFELLQETPFALFKKAHKLNLIPAETQDSHPLGCHSILQHSAVTAINANRDVLKTKQVCTSTPWHKSQGQECYSKRNRQLSQGSTNQALQRHAVKPSYFAIILATDTTCVFPWDISAATTTGSSWHPLLSGTVSQCAQSWS